MEQVHGKEHPMTVEAKILASRLLPKEDASELLKELLQSVEYGVGLNHRCTIDIKLEIAKVLDEQIKDHMVVLEKYEKIHGRSGKLLRREGEESALMLFAEGEATTTSLVKDGARSGGTSNTSLHKRPPGVRGRKNLRSY